MSKFTVLVTRPDPAGSALCRELNEHDCDTVHLPTISFAPPADITQLQAGIAALGEQAWLIFVSPQAVVSATPQIRRAWPNLPPDLRFAAIGAGTAQALEAAGYQAVYPAQDWHAEGLLAMPELQQVTGKHIAIIRGAGGREVLEPALSKRGAHVMSVITYRRVVPQVETRDYIALFMQQHINAIVCTSYSSVENLKHMLGAQVWAQMQALPLIVVSERIKQLAAKLGFQTIWVANNASHDAIVETVEGIKNVR